MSHHTGKLQRPLNYAWHALLSSQGVTETLRSHDRVSAEGWHSPGQYTCQIHLSPLLVVCFELKVNLYFALLFNHVGCFTKRNRSANFVYRSSLSSKHTPMWCSGDMTLCSVHVTIYGLLAVVSVAMATKCGAAEYKTGKECCPMCSPGHYVVHPCTEDISTTCLPCPPQTFTDKHNGLTRCLSCSVCDTTAGLRVKGNCTSSSDTLCEPLEGHYCTDPIKDGCRGAVEHTKCLPGQHIKQPGSASSDTVCGDCGNNTYSDGTFTSCRPHTQCGLKGLDVLKEGSSSYDTECGRRHMHIGFVAVLLLLALGGLGIFICIHRKKKGRNK